MKAFGKTDKGLVRANNQDTFLIDDKRDDIMFIVLCDGMGGAKAGNIASAKAAELFMAKLAEQGTPEMNENEMAELLIEAAATANEGVFELSKSAPEYEGMGTTLVGGVCVNETVTLINIGDSRAYVLDDRQIAQVTRDHSWVEELIMQGRLTRAEAATFPQRNVITRAVGVDPQVDGDLYRVTLAEGQTILLCSDGLSGMVSDGEIAQLHAGAESQEQACETLVRAACEHGGHDNVTVVLYSI
ncbi:MAG: Stp1/IreP family PP2C-type Ser/Thr phosphatase [Butyricicoccaceae bacterium]